MLNKNCKLYLTIKSCWCRQKIVLIINKCLLLVAESQGEMGRVCCTATSDVVIKMLPNSENESESLKMRK